MSFLETGRRNYPRIRIKRIRRVSKCVLKHQANRFDLNLVKFYLRQDFSKDRPSLGTVVKKFLDFDEIWHSDAFQGETDENSSQFF